MAIFNSYVSSPEGTQKKPGNYYEEVKYKKELTWTN